MNIKLIIPILFIFADIFVHLVCFFVLALTYMHSYLSKPNTLFLYCLELAKTGSTVTIYYSPLI